MSQQTDPPGDPYAHLDGAYLLGGLSAEDRADYEAHLEHCSRCREAVDDLGSVLPYLAVADETDLDAAPGGLPPLPDTLLPQLLAAAGRVRRRRRALVTGLAALAAACVAVVVLLTTGVFASPSAPGRPMTALAATPVTAEVTLEPTAWGTKIDLTCRYRSGASASPGYSYALSVRGTDGRSHQLGTWQLSPGTQVTFTTGTALSVAQITSIDITDPYGTRLLTLST